MRHCHLRVLHESPIAALHDKRCFAPKAGRSEERHAEAHALVFTRAGIYLTQIPPLDYARHLFHEKNLRSVTANTRQDGEELFRLAASIPLRPKTTTFPLADANIALQQLKHGGIRGTGVLVID